MYPFLTASSIILLGIHFRISTSAIYIIYDFHDLIFKIENESRIQMWCDNAQGESWENTREALLSRVSSWLFVHLVFGLFFPVAAELWI